jgi:PAS domain S-box-containing protein
MRKYNHLSWLFPCGIFVFFSIFLSVKFIFIFFFRAAYEPTVLFELTPFYLFSGFNLLQLLFLSLVLMLADTYLHIKPTRRNLMYSYLPTSLMLSGFAYTIMFRDINISYVYHYVIFGCLLFIVLIDYRNILTPVEISLITPRKKPMGFLEEEKPFTILPKPMGAEAMKYYGEPQLTSREDISYNLKESYESTLQNIQAVFEILKRKTIKLETLENEIEERRKSLIEQEENLIDRLFYYVKSKDRFEYEVKSLSKEISSADKIFSKDEVENHLVIDDTTDFVAVVQRDILKQVSNSLANFLGYEINDMINKNLFIFFTPEGIENVKKYCLSRLRGAVTNSYKTVFVTKNFNEIPVEITIKPTIYKGEKAEFLVIKEIKN